MALRTTLALPFHRARGTLLNWLKRTATMVLHIATCGLIGPRSANLRITDTYGNTYSFGRGTSDEQIEAILSVPTGGLSVGLSVACNDVHTAFAKTDNLEIRIAPTKSPANTADNWRIIRLCPDTGSGVCLIAQNVA